MATITIERGLMDRLADDTAVKAVVVARIYPMKLPQTVTMPAITVQRITTSRVHTHDGAGGTAYPRIEVTSWAGNWTDCKALADKVRTCLDGFKGTIGTTDSVIVQATLSDDERHFYDPGSQLYWLPLDFIVWHLE